jgi:preprotein translocase subunit SecE
MSENERLDQIPEEELPAQPAEEETKPETKAKDQKGTDKKNADKKNADKKNADKKDKAKKKGKGNRVTRWLREMRSELKKVQWPTWKQVLKNTGIVILCVLVVGVFIWIFDALAHAIIQALMHLFS